ncbi:MAG: hypothetical protein EOP90_02030 [Lysobacteraceae bacterium]|nr:MAG: hypothetical protein EOP90_02030 [Xanthomonadaceae bacterium]
MNRPRDEHDLERLLGDDHGEFGTLYRRLARSEPPRRLDRAVLGEAARAVRGRAPRVQRWLVGLGSAAGIVLAAGIAWRVGQEAAMQPSTPPLHAPESIEIVPVQPIVERGRAPAGAAARADQAAAAPATAQAAADAGSPPREVVAAKRAARATPPAKPAEPPPPSPIVEQPPAAPMPFPQTRQDAGAADSASGFRNERAQPAEEKAEAEQLREPERLRARAAPAPSASVQLRRDQQLEPTEWLAHVRELLRDGRRQQASESLRLFHRTHPRHEVPADLRHLLE